MPGTWVGLVGVGVWVSEGVGVWVLLGVTLRVTDGVTVEVGVSVSVGVTDAVGVRLAVGVGLPQKQVVSLEQRGLRHIPLIQVRVVPPLPVALLQSLLAVQVD